jgi:hypothetical protein
VYWKTPFGGGDFCSGVCGFGFLGFASRWHCAFALNSDYMDSAKFTAISGYQAQSRAQLGLGAERP